MLQSTIKNCAVTGELSIDWGRDIYTGGLVGNLNNAGKIEYCYSTVNIDAEVGAAVNYVGGIAGYAPSATSVVSQVYATGNMTLSSSFNNSYVGGIVGRNNGQLENAYATGNHVIISAATLSYTGGIAGMNYDGSIVRSYATGNITGHYAGGIAGHNGGTGKVISCVALNSALSGSVPYRIVGSNSATLTNHYGRTGMTGARTNGSDALLFNGTDCDAQPTQEWWKTAATWAGGGSAWNFNTIWEFKDGYPKLRNMPVFKN